MLPKDNHLIVDGNDAERDGTVDILMPRPAENYKVIVLYILNIQSWPWL